MSVGTDFQSEEFWWTLLPDRCQREQLVPCHFQISMSHRENQAILLLHAVVATEVNSIAVDGEVAQPNRRHEITTKAAQPPNCHTLPPSVLQLPLELSMSTCATLYCTLNRHRHNPACYAFIIPYAIDL